MNVDRNIIAFKDNQGICYQGDLLKFTRHKVVFESYNAHAIIRLSEIIHDVKVFRVDTLLYEGKALITNLINNGLYLIATAHLLNDWQTANPINADIVKQHIQRFLRSWESHRTTLSPAYQAIVGQLNAFLHQCQHWLDTMSSHCSHQPALLATVSNEITPLIQEAHGLIRTFEQQVRQLIPQLTREQTTSYRYYAQKALHPLLMASPLAHRLLYKPLGFSGDHVTVCMMTAHQQKAPLSLFAEFLDQVLIQTTLVYAHCNRLTIVQQHLTSLARKAAVHNNTLQVMNIGSGAAIEIQRFAKDTVELLTHCHFHLVDCNKDALEYVKAALSAQTATSKHRFRFTQYTVHELLQQNTDIATAVTNHFIQSYDVIYCTGLFDYLPSRVCLQLIQAAYKWLKPGGTMLFANSHSCNPNRYFMEMLFDWYLIYRDPNDMKTLFQEEGHQRTFIDQKGGNVFLEVIKPK